jgi:hypothetical protein
MSLDIETRTISPCEGTISTLKSSSCMLLLLLVLVSCNQSKDQWTLQSYDKDKGYVFVRNGVEYKAKCFATGQPVLGAPPNETPDTSSDAMPPNPAFGQESACDNVLPYLHKPIPHFRQDGSLLVLTEEKNYKLEFEIIHAK